MKDNIVLNRVEAKCTALLGDAKKTVASELREVADRVLMHLPEKAYEYLDSVRGIESRRRFRALL